jgi:hypothetical protein
VSGRAGARPSSAPAGRTWRLAHGRWSIPIPISIAIANGWRGEAPPEGRAVASATWEGHAPHAGPVARERDPPAPLRDAPGGWFTPQSAAPTHRRTDNGGTRAVASTIGHWRALRTTPLQVALEAFKPSLGGPLSAADAHGRGLWDEGRLAIPMGDTDTDIDSEWVAVGGTGRMDGRMVSPPPLCFRSARSAHVSSRRTARTRSLQRTTKNYPPPPHRCTAVPTHRRTDIGGAVAENRNREPKPKPTSETDTDQDGDYDRGREISDTQEWRDTLTRVRSRRSATLQRPCGAHMAACYPRAVARERDPPAPLRMEGNPAGSRSPCAT